jgi:hypothetical protein
MLDALIMFAGTSGVMLVGAFANRFARMRFDFDIARWLALPGLFALVASLLLSFWPPQDHLRFRLGFFLVLAAGLLGVLALGALSARPGPADIRSVYRMGAAAIAAFGIALASLFLAFGMMWSDLHMDLMPDPLPVP